MNVIFWRIPLFILACIISLFIVQTSDIITYITYISEKPLIIKVNFNV